MEFQRMKKIASVTALAGVLMIVGTGCSKENKFIEKATFEISDTLENLRASLVFTNKVKAPFSGGFAVKQYGGVFINPYTTTTPFEAGFNLNLNIIYDQDYIHLAPTTTLPNGMPTGLPYAVVEVNLGEVWEDKLELLAYVDIRKGEWLGMAGLVSLIDENFPSGLVLSQVFLRDKTGRPAILGSFFGPYVNEQGQLLRAGGLALFANWKGIKDAIGMRRGKIDFFPEDKIVLSGPEAPYYESHPRELKKVAEKFMKAFETQLP